MKLTVEMPWERDLSVNHMRYGAGGGHRKKEHVQTWMQRLAGELPKGRCGYWIVQRWSDLDMNESWHPVTTPIYVCVDFRFPNKRKIDDHNLYYVIANAVAKGLGIDDKDIRISTGTIEVDRDNPGFTITVEDAD